MSQSEKHSCEQSDRLHYGIIVIIIIIAVKVIACIFPIVKLSAVKTADCLGDKERLCITYQIHLFCH